MNDYPEVKRGETLEEYRARIGLCPKCARKPKKCLCDPPFNPGKSEKP